MSFSLILLALEAHLLALLLSHCFGLRLSHETQKVVLLIAFVLAYLCLQVSDLLEDLVVALAAEACAGLPS